MQERLTINARFCKRECVKTNGDLPQQIPTQRKASREDGQPREEGILGQTTSLENEGKNPRGPSQGGVPQLAKVTRRLVMAYSKRKCSTRATICHEHTHPPTFKQRDKKPHLQVLVFIQQIKISPSKEFHQRNTRKQLALTQKNLLNRGASLQRALARVKQMHSVLSHKFLYLKGE